MDVSREAERGALPGGLLGPRPGGDPGFHLGRVECERLWNIQGEAVAEQVESWIHCPERSKPQLRETTGQSWSLKSESGRGLQGSCAAGEGGQKSCAEAEELPGS